MLEVQGVSLEIEGEREVEILKDIDLKLLKCRGHIQCDAIIMHNAQVLSTPRISAYHSDAQLVHEAAIGRIESEQLIKLMSMGLTEKEAEDMILKGFLK